MVLNNFFRFLITCFLLGACASTNESVYFKNKKGQTGIFELDSKGDFYRELGDSTNFYKLPIKESIGINEFESLTLDKGYCIEEKCIEFKLTETGTELYAALTKKNIGKQVFYVIDGVIILKLTVAGVIDNGMGQFPINGKYFDSFFIR